MNNDRRKALETLRRKIDEAKGELESLREEEQDYYDNMPENMQSAEKGEKAQASIDALDEAISALEEADTKIEEASE